MQLDNLPTLHQLGHRQRLRKRLLISKLGELPDYEILEYILSLAIPRKDTKPLAKELVKHFGSLAKVIYAEENLLMNFQGIGESVIACFKSFSECAMRLSKQELIEKPIISSFQNLLSFCRVSIGHNKKESFITLFLDKKNHLISQEIIDYGTVDQISVYPREIAKKALINNSSAIILVHNHPSGDTKPSSADIVMTRQISKALEPFNIKIHDHLIISDQNYFSFRAEKLIK